MDDPLATLLTTKQGILIESENETSLGFGLGAKQKILRKCFHAKLHCNAQCFRIQINVQNRLQACLLRALFILKEFDAQWSNSLINVQNQLQVKRLQL